MNQEPILTERIQLYLDELQKLIQPIRAETTLRPPKGGAEITLAWRSLQIAEMWLGQALAEIEASP